MIDIYDDIMDVILDGKPMKDEYIRTLVEQLLRINEKVSRPDNLPELLREIFLKTKDILLNDTEPITSAGDTQKSAPILKALFTYVYKDVDSKQKMDKLKYLLDKTHKIADSNTAVSDLLAHHYDLVRTALEEARLQKEHGVKIQEGLLDELEEKLKKAAQIDQFMSLVDTPNTAPYNVELVPTPKFLKAEDSGAAAAASPAAGGGSKVPPQINNLDRKNRRTRKSNRRNKRKTRRSKT